MNTTSPQEIPLQAEECLAGGGEMGALMRSLDWAATPLGPVAAWPQSLKTSVSLCLNSGFPLLVWWGTDLVMLYNDAYRPLIGDKHPTALGRDGREVWPEIWDIIGPMLHGVLEAGTATRSEDLLLFLERHGYPEECYFTFSYSPIRDETGGIGGVFTPVQETTEKVVSARRLSTLRDLAAQSILATEAAEASRLSAEVLARDPYDIPFALMYLLDDTRTEARLVGTAGIAAGTRISPACIPFANLEATSPLFPLRRAAHTNTAECIEEPAAKFGLLPGGAWNIAPKTLLVLPITLADSTAPLGLLVAAINPHKVLDSDYRSFYDLVAGQIASILARKQSEREKELLLDALEGERSRLTTLFMQAPAFIAVMRGPTHVFEMANPPYYQLVGERDLLGRPVREAFPEVEGQGFFELLDEVYQTGKPFIGTNMRIFLQTKADAPPQERYLDFVYQPLLESDGCVSGILAHGVDLTERKRAEEALQASELKLRSLFENARDAIGIATKGRIAFVNPAYARLLGYASPEEMIGMSALDPVAPGDRERLVQMAQRRNAGEAVPFSYEYRGRKKDGTECDLENYVSSYELDGQTYTVVTTRDITAQKQEEIARQFLAEASALLASSLDYEQTLQQVADLAVPHIADWCGVDMLEQDGTISQLAVAHVNPEKVKWGHELRKRYPPDPADPRGLPNVLRTGKAEIYSHIPDELLVAGARDAQHLEMMRQIGLDSLMMVPMIARERILGAITFVATDESGHHYTEEDLELAEGLAARAAIAIDNARLYRAAQEELARRRRVQEALHASEERFRFALANSSIIVYTQDRDLRYTWVYNGASKGEDSHVYGKTDADILAVEDAVPLMEIKRRVLQSGVEERHVIRATPLGQAPLYLDTSFAPLRDGVGNIVGITGTANDITERKQAQDALARHQAEIEALNIRLRRSMRETHHRVKNNLQVITALVNMQQMQYEDQVPTAELQRLTQHIKALASIHDLLTHQAQTDAEVSDISIQDIMTKLMPTVQGMVEGRSLTFAVQDMRLPVRQSTTFAILVNELVSNALKHGAGEIHVGFSVEGNTAVLQVLDEGAGFPPDFNPISAANTGLDLIGSLARMDMRGDVRYENREEGGARVLIEFPVPSLLKTPGEQ